ncbi:hypothetical protein BB558_002512 [Smittium angustum]|uniref:Nucleoporin NDC1 n=1 Tax=Smittium angustum TaxID=133377 RepID=A0A2U1J8G6_SMIAN|nr:hypothetical protein BB558_002512 [Smittium angustum]
MKGKKTFMDYAEDEYNHRIQSVFVYCFICSYIGAIVLQSTKLFSSAGILAVLFGFTTIKLLLGFFVACAINILLIHSFGHVNYKSFDKRLWLTTELLINTRNILILAANFIFISLIGFFTVGFSSFKFLNNAWIYPEGEYGPPQLSPQFVLVIVHIIVYSLIVPIYQITNRKYFLQVEFLDQKKAFAIRNKIMNSIKFSFGFGVRYTLWFWVFYMAFGGIIYHSMSTLVSYLYRTVDYDLGNPLLKTSLFFSVLYNSVFLVLFSEISIHTYKQIIMMTSFVSSSTQQFDEILVNGLALNDEPMFQVWAFSELYYISLNDKDRRKELYLNLNKTSNDTWKQVSDLSLQVLSTTISQINNLINSINLKKKSAYSQNSSNTTLSESLLGKSVVEKDEPKIMKYATDIINKTLDNIESFDEPPSHEIINNPYLQILSIRALTNFVVASAQEDDYGQVLRTIPKTISTFLAYYDSITNFIKLDISSSIFELRNSSDINSFPSSGVDTGDIDILVEVIRSSIYAIITKYYTHLQEFDLDKKSKKMLQEFIDCKL